MPLQIDIVTPHGTAYTGTVDEITVPGEKGEMGLLPGHIPVISALTVGELVAKTGGKAEVFAVEGGFVEVARDRVNVITERAMRPAQIDLVRVQEDREEALADLKAAEGHGMAAVASANQALQRADALEAIAKRHVGR